MDKTDFDSIASLGTGYGHHFHSLEAGDFSTLRDTSDAQLKHESGVLAIWQCQHPEHGHFVLAEVMSEEFYMITPNRPDD